jgi:hypothetical protein
MSSRRPARPAVALGVARPPWANQKNEVPLRVLTHNLTLLAAA